MVTTSLKSSLLKLIGKDPVDNGQQDQFQQTQEAEQAFEPVDRGVSLVDIDKIAGSVGRYHDFDKSFRLRNRSFGSNERTERIRRAIQEGKPMDPISLYQIKDSYYILDGHHRYSVLKELGHRQIQAKILELLPSADTMENQLYLEKVHFRDRTGLAKTIELTEPGQYEHLNLQIKNHQDHLTAEQGQQVSFSQAAADWHRSIYLPLRSLIKKSGLVRSFSDRTVDDLYLYISVHQWEKKSKVRKYGIGIDKLIPRDMEEFRDKMASRRENEYPDMKQDITVFILLNVEGLHEQKIFDKLSAMKEVKELHSVHGSIDLVVKVVLSRELLASDAELISQFTHRTIRKMRGVISTQTLIPGLSVVK
ncbi:MAG: Lrp/AsnC ligand binding domain-containing protein [Thermodesulfobacteriota bacterium]